MKGPVILAFHSVKAPGLSVRTNPVPAQHIRHVDADNQKNDAGAFRPPLWRSLGSLQLFLCSSRRRQSGCICIVVRRERWGTACTVIMPVRHRARPKMEAKGRFMTLPS